jgi:hypothetical protein
MFQKAFSMGCLRGDAEAYMKHNKDCGQSRVGEAGVVQADCPDLCGTQTGLLCDGVSGSFRVPLIFFRQWLQRGCQDTWACRLLAKAWL